MDVINKFLKTNFDRQQRKIVWRQIVIFGSVLMMTFAFAPPIGFIDTLIRIIIMAAATDLEVIIVITDALNCSRQTAEVLMRDEFAVSPKEFEKLNHNNLSILGIVFKKVD